MTSDLEILLYVLLAVLALGALGGIGYIVVSSHVRALRAANSRWETFARERGLAFQQRPPRVSGRVDGVDVSVGLSTRGPTGQQQMMTIVRAGAPASAPDPGWLRVVTRGTARGAMTALFGVVPTNDPAFDARFVLETADPSRAHAVLSDDVRARLVAFPREGELTAGAASVTLAWSGQEVDAAVLEEACRLVARAAR